MLHEVVSVHGKARVNSITHKISVRSCLKTVAVKPALYLKQ